MKQFIISVAIISEVDRVSTATYSFVCESVMEAKQRAYDQAVAEYATPYKGYRVMKNPRTILEIPVLSLYIWREVFPDYGEGMAYALATSEEEARALIFARSNVTEESPWGNTYRNLMGPASEVYTEPYGDFEYGGA